MSDLSLDVGAMVSKGKSERLPPSVIGKERFAG
jgi:hypothetical protein